MFVASVRWVLSSLMFCQWRCLTQCVGFPTYSGGTILTSLRPPFAHLATINMVQLHKPHFDQRPYQRARTGTSSKFQAPTMSLVVVQVILGEHRHAVLQAEGRTPLTLTAVQARHPVAHMRARRPQAGQEGKSLAIYGGSAARPQRFRATLSPIRGRRRWVAALTCFEPGRTSRPVLCAAIGCPGTSVGACRS